VTISAAGGTGKGDQFTFSVSPNSLTSWLTLNSTGVLQGTPPSTTGSPLSFTVTASDMTTGQIGSRVFVLTVNPATPTVMVSDGAGTFNATPFVATATVSGVNGVPGTSLEGVTPTLTYYVGSNTSGTSLGSAAPSAAGTYTVVASFAGSADYTSASSTPVTFTINPATTQTRLSSSGNPSGLGQSVTFGATVGPIAPGGGIPSGTVTFKDGATTLGTVGLTNGVGTLSTTGLTLGSHSITAVYNSDTTNYTGSTAAPLTQVVENTSKTTLTVSSPTSIYGQTVTLTATVAHGTGTGTPTGTVTFMDGGTAVGTASLTNGAASLSVTTALAAGPHSFTAVYNGSSVFVSSTSAAVAHTVNVAATSTALASSSNPAVYGQQVTLTATISVLTPGGGTPTGSVVFQDGTTVLGTAAISGRVATLRVSLAVGSHALSATFSSSTGNYTGSLGTLTQTVNKAATTTTLTSSLNPSVLGQSVTFTATVKASAPGSGMPTGTVTFKDGTTALATVTLSGGVAVFSTSSLAVGTHSITAVYSSDTGNYTTSTSTTVSQVVKKASTTVLTTSLTPSLFGQSVTFKVTVTGSGGTPTGSVTFKDGVTVLGTATLFGGTASLATARLTAGTHNITAIYNGDSTFGGSTSAVLVQTVS
jgi:hypothetical protein